MSTRDLPVLAAADPPADGRSIGDGGKDMGLAPWSRSRGDFSREKGAASDPVFERWRSRSQRSADQAFRMSATPMFEGRRAFLRPLYAPDMSLDIGFFTSWYGEVPWSSDRLAAIGAERLGRS
jgi:hypothetical protein